jgi:hypothetical protein
MERIEQLRQTIDERIRGNPGADQAHILAELGAEHPTMQKGTPS